MPDRWDARIFAKSKTDRYAIWNGAQPNPFLRHVVWHVPAALDIDRMQRATVALVGEHDFAAFKGRGTDVMTTVRRVLSAEIVEMNMHTDQPIALSPLDPLTSPGASGAIADGGRLLRFEISGSGFLRHMVRTIAGTLVDIGRGRMPPEEMAAIIASRDRARSGQTAPPQGLMLWAVRY
jgi:tRNA pseudouridine38-40 synthase